MDQLNDEFNAKFSTNTSEVISNELSPVKGWNRCSKKYLLSQDLHLSPVKQILCTLQRNNDDPLDLKIDGAIWMLSMSEQFYYDNTIQLIASHIKDRENLQKVIINNYQAFAASKFVDSLVEINSIGYGTFGEVVKAKINETGEWVAIKYFLIRTIKQFCLNTKQVLDYIEERKYLIQTYNSPFIMRFKRSFQLTKIKVLFLVFEYCISDLDVYCKLLFNTKDFNLPKCWLLDNPLNLSLEKDHEEVGKKLNFNIHQITIIWSFELFCILNFLGECNLVHRDIKISNIMIGSDGHLKLGDFGLINNTHFILRDEQTYLHRQREFDALDNIPSQEMSIVGTKAYFDMESCLLLMKTNDYCDFRDMADYPEFIATPQYKIPNEKTFQMDTLSDIWAMGCVISELLFLGTKFWFPKIGCDITHHFLSFERCDPVWNVARLFYHSTKYDRYIKTGMLNYCGDAYKDLIELLVSIFSPRRVRALKYTKPFMRTNWQHKQETRIIDIKKIEEMEIFSDLSLNEHTVLTYQFTQTEIELLTKKSRRQCMNSKEWLESVKRQTNTEDSLFSFEPGCSLRWV